MVPPMARGFSAFARGDWKTTIEDMIRMGASIPPEWVDVLADYLGDHFPARVDVSMTVEAKPVGAAGTVLVAGSNGMTVYIFTKDTKDSGKSVCTGDCLVTWPALTVAAGETPTGGAGVTGKFGTITREDDGTLQVTYNGLPLYFFKNDKAPGYANGIYENWEAVKP